MKSLKLIRTDADYEAALTEIEHLWGARAGTLKDYVRTAHARRRSIRSYSLKCSFPLPTHQSAKLEHTTISLMSKRSNMKSLKPIRTDADYEAALAEIERLWGTRVGTPEGDRLDILATLVDAYENEHYPMDPPDPIEAIKFRMEQQGLTRKDLEGILGSRTRVAEVLNRRRNLSINMIRRLHEKLGISAEVLLRPSRASKAA